MKTNSFNRLSDQVNKHPILFYGASMLVYLVLFFAFIDRISPDYSIFLEPWTGLIKDRGFLILRENFYNYAPSYMYLLALSTLIPLKPVITIKLLSLPVIPLGGYYMTRLAARFDCKPVMTWLGFTATLLAPTILLNSAYWGQADVFYGVASLACVLYLLDRNPYAAMLALGIALSVKFQIIFLGPFLFVMLIKKQIPWKSILIPPAVFVASAIPLLLIGKPIQDALLVYFKQAATIGDLCGNCTSFWSIFPDLKFDIGVYTGFILALIALEGYLFLMFRRLNIHNPRQVYMAALLSAMLAPFFLPLMHDRYFYMAEMLAIGIFLMDWRYGAIPLLLQISALNVYWWYLMQNGYLYPQYISGFLNLIAIGLMIWLFLRQIEEPVSRQTEKIPSSLV